MSQVVPAEIKFATLGSKLTNPKMKEAAEQGGLSAICRRQPAIAQLGFSRDVKVSWPTLGRQELSIVEV